MKPDIEIARAAKLRPITDIACEIGLPESSVVMYGRNKAKVDHRILKNTAAENKNGKLIMVTAMTPTPAGEGKTTTSVGLADALNRIGCKTILTLREPSLGPVFGVKGGAAGGGYAQVVPMEDINLHFTGDIHAVGAANNLLAAMTDNHIYHGNEPKIDPERVTWRRCLDMNDRQLRNINDGLGGKTGGVPRPDGFDITAASEVMAVLCLASDLNDLKKRLGRMVVGYTYDNEPVTAARLGAAGALTALLKEAFDPNLAQTLEGNPAFIHGGPFANIAHGCNSIIATKLAAKFADYVVTEAGFGADLGAEKFIDIKCRKSGLYPSAAVVVATVRALKYHGKSDAGSTEISSLTELTSGLENLRRHIENLRDVFNLPVVTAVNVFPSDTPEEHGIIADFCAGLGVPCALSEVFEKGSAGGEKLALLVRDAAKNVPKPVMAYADDLGLKEKIDTVCQRIYKADSVRYSETATEKLGKFEQSGYGTLPVCIAKTQYSFSDDASISGAPAGFTIGIRDVRLAAGAGFIIAVAGKIMTMPGLPKKPAAEEIDIDEDGVISGLF